MLRRTLMIVAFAAIVLSRIDPLLLQFPFHDRASLGPLFQFYADRNWQEYAKFLRGVREQTRSGERVAVLVPVTEWERGYSYAYYRASYILAGREVLPVFDSADRVHLENLRRADVVAVWRAPVPSTHRTLVWRGDGGVVVRR